MTDAERVRAKSRYYYFRRAFLARGEVPPTYEQWFEDRCAEGFDPRLPKGKPRGTHPLSYARKRYSRHRAQAKYRNIPWQFDFDSWYAWWASHGIDRNIPNPERGRDRLCMCRHGDEGPYSPGNVYLATHSENTKDSFQNVARPGFSDGWPKGKKRK